MIWFTADPHFFHTNIIKYCNRPFANTSEMNRTLRENWHKVVATRDTIYVIGDFALGSAGLSDHLCQSLPGKKILIRGNHDRGRERCLKMGFEEVLDEYILMVDTWPLLLNHFPYTETHSGRKPIDKGMFLLCGHVHNNWKAQTRTLNVGVDVWDFTPVSLDQIIEERGKILS